MKHILNNLTEQEKNAIREQHTGGMKVMTENFSKLINSKLGDSKPLVSEQVSNPFKIGQVIKAIRDKDQKPYTIKIVNVGNYYVVANITGPGTYKEGSIDQPLDGKASYELTSNQPGQLSGNGNMGIFKITQ